MVQGEIQEKQILLEKLEVRMNEAESKVKELKLSFENLCGKLGAPLLFTSPLSSFKSVWATL